MTVSHALENYFTATRVLRHPDGLPQDEIFYGRMFAENWICAIIEGRDCRLKERAIEAAREFGFVVPVGMRG